MVFFAMGGCTGWHGRKGMVERPDGARAEVKGPIADLDACDGRKVMVLLDANVASNKKVAGEERKLVAELRNRRCSVSTCRLPMVDGVNGPDDYISVASDDAVAEVFQKARLQDGPIVSKDFQAETVDGIPTYSESVLAEQFAAEHGAKLRFVAALGKAGTWFYFDDGRSWTADETLFVPATFRKFCSAKATLIGNPMIAARMTSAKTIAAVERLARGVEPIPATIGQWDRNPWLLGTPAGKINLKLGAIDAFKLVPIEPADYISRSTAVVPGGDCRLWRAFLTQTTGGDQDMEDFLQRWFGYVITADTSEQILVDAFGPPGTGKTTLIDTPLKVLGSYATTADIETFAEQRQRQHSTEMARLEGFRYVVTTEVTGHFLNESRINSVSGGEQVVAHRMGVDDRSWTPTFKLAVKGNERPKLKNATGGIARRLKLLPLTAVVANPDKQLGDKLVAEYPGILQWMLDGCRMWQQFGLVPPESVSSATGEYLASEDGVGRWLEECTEKTLLPKPAPVADLYASYRAWGDAGNEYYYSCKRFSQELLTRGYAPARTSLFRGFTGIKLRGGAD